MMNSRLENSKSSYLRKAASDPVDWYPWSDEAFEKARKEGKPVLLSIGAVWCHWCHVMALESWQDPDTARMVNEWFIPVKVDRDERPEIDKAYQEAVNAFRGTGGWPLTVFLTPDKQPFYGGTYFPNFPRHGLPSFKEVLMAVSQAYKNDPDGVKAVTSQVMKIYGQVPLQKAKTDPVQVDIAVKDILGKHDRVNGGFGTAPKFPHSETLLFLLQRYETTGDSNIWEAIDRSLKKMAMGGIYDQVGGGFHRYSTDASWMVPHFEKMLNDNALLLSAYLLAYQRSGNVYFKHVSEEIISFIIRDLAREPAGFSSSIDADVHGEEGGYFVWAEDEIKGLLGEKAGAFIKAYHVIKEGNFEDDKNILYTIGEADRSAFNAEKKILIDARYKREMPYVDHNIITSWNALTITSLIKAYNILGDIKSLEYAIKATDFILDKIYVDGQLYHMFSDSPSVKGYLEDYACLIESLIELFMAIQDEKYLDAAKKLIIECNERFYDGANGGYFYVDKADRNELTQEKPIIDYYVPAPNALMALDLLKCYHLTGEERHMEMAMEILELFYEPSRSYPTGFATYLSALEYYFDVPDEVVVAANKGEGMDIVRAVNSMVNKRVVTLYDGRVGQAIFEGKVPIDGKPTAYFCKKGSCQKPINDIESIKRSLKGSMLGR